MAARERGAVARRAVVRGAAATAVTRRGRRCGASGSRRHAAALWCDDVWGRVAWQTLAHTAMIAAAMTAHGDVVTWCVHHTAARPWVVAKALVCIDCCMSGSCTLSHMCEVEGHNSDEGWDTAAVLAACSAGDVSLLRRLMTEHVECESGVRLHTLVDDVSVLCMWNLVVVWLTAEGLTLLPLWSVWGDSATAGVPVRSHRCGSVACVGGRQRCAVGARQCRSL